MSSRHKAGLGRLARWGGLATTLATAVALLAASWANLRAVDEASETLHRGQGEPLVMAVRQLTRRFSGPPPAEALEVLLQVQEPSGLRWVGLVGPGDTVLAEAGERTAELLRERGEKDRPVRIVDLGARILMRSGPGNGPPDGRPPGDGRDRLRPPFEDRRFDSPRPDRRPGALRPPVPTIVIEFEPLVVNRLSERAMGSFVFSVLTAAFLLAAAGVFWRLLVEQEEAERHLEHERRLQALGEMSAVMAHEIRNPLASLKGNAQILAERLPAEGRERGKAQRIVREAQRLESLCQALLDFCRTQPLERREVDPTALVREVADSLENSHVELDAATAPERWSLDPLRMRQVLLNLLGNARQASPEGEPVEVRVARANGRLVIAVRDRGEGIPPGEEERLFEPFFTKRTRGTGLGLAVARRVVELHGGALSAGNVAGGGAEFRISIPGER